MSGFTFRPAIREAVALEKRFWRHVEKDENGCWLWTGSIFKNGYGRIRFGNHTCVAHRIAYQLAVGSIPDELLVLHKCDIRNCCNPEHLFLGTDQDNIDDCIKKGRRAKHSGELHGMAKLTNADILKIRERRSTGEYLSNIAKDFFVTSALISLIAKKKIWRHI